MRLSANDQMVFAKRLAFLVGSGMPIFECMHVLKNQAPSPRTEVMFDIIIDDVANGRLLSASLARFENAFGEFAINIIRTGELSGNLASNLTHLSEELRKKYLLRKKIIGAMIYPIIVTVATIAIATLLTVYIFPKIVPIFKTMDLALPVTTKALLWVSTFLQKNGVLVACTSVAVLVGVWFFRRKNSTFRALTDRLILAFPLVGTIALRYNMANFCRTMSLLIKSGMTIAEALKITGESMPNRVYGNVCRSLIKSADSGKPLSELLNKAPRFFPELARHLIATGEASGNLAATLAYLADMYESDVDDLTKNLSQAIEPVLMIAMGLVVGIVAISVITPIYEITRGIQN